MAIMSEDKVTQKQLILDYIDEFGSTTPLEAIRDLGVYRLASRISDLRKIGYPIETNMETVLNRRGKKSIIARYSMGGGADAAI